MRPSCGFSRASKQILSGRDSKPALALITKALSRYFAISLFRYFAISLFRYFAISLFRYFAISLQRYLAISLSRCLTATILVKSVGVLWWWQRDLNQYSFI